MSPCACHEKPRLYVAQTADSSCALLAVTWGVCLAVSRSLEWCDVPLYYEEPGRTWRLWPKGEDDADP